jgi:spore coat protein CotF
MGVKAEFTAILSLFENDQRPRTERNIIMMKIKNKPFNDFSGNKSELVKKTLGEMVDQKLLAKLMDTGKPQYILAQ